MIQRIFHPVGQGAFYSERHENYKIVYDCGCMSVSKGKKVVSQSFSKEDVIDILFISHFDYDHISLIEDLKTTVKEIRNVVIPLLHDNEKILLSNVFKALGEYSLASLVQNPEEFFGAETHIISVQPSSEEGINKDAPSILLNEINQDPIPSGSPITIDNGSDWVFTPFNYEYKDRNKEFLDKLESDEIDKLKSSKHIFDSEFRNKIKKTYKKVSGNINENSMFLYSGPYPQEKNSPQEENSPKEENSLKEENSPNYKGLDWTFKYLDESSFKYFLDTPSFSLSECSFSDPYKNPFLKNFLPCLYRVACLYTGDGDLNKVNVKNIYEETWDLIGTIQIPHHGSLKSFKENILKDQHFLCPISVGKKNPYGHPSREVVRKILSNTSFPIFVTEDVDSKFTETIEKINN